MAEAYWRHSNGQAIQDRLAKPFAQSNTLETDLPTSTYALSGAWHYQACPAEPPQRVTVRSFSIDQDVRFKRVMLLWAENHFLLNQPLCHSTMRQPELAVHVCAR